MIHGFRSAMRESFFNAVVTVDKFHVIKNCSDAVDSTRKQELRCKDPDNLTDKQRERLGQLLQVEYLDTVQAYSYRLELGDFSETHKAYDEGMLFSL